ncbi:MAG: hypothetical protein A2Z34_01970 [Planctomycetes bacterium RBG_16_59_8]|nr:MAG: hypothetical protein A2Z34_01970 [Planctomycetes bacterium RBG_16_59_8]
MSFRLTATERFLDQADRLPEEVRQQLVARLRFLEANQRHPSLQTHEIKHAIGDFGGKIFESYVNAKYRMSWEYGSSRGEIFLRNVDNHDACLNRP